ncbi:Tail-tube assembly protein [compost metagenome]
MTLEGFGDNHSSRLVFTATTVITGDEPDAGKSKAFGNYKRLRFSDIGSVFMYMPKMQQSYTQNYSDDGRGLIWQMYNAFQSAGGVDNFGDAGAAALKVGIAQGINTVAPGMTRDFSQTVKNQYMSSHFTGTQLRKQKFDFELRPRNEEELFQVAGLIQFFKANSASSLGASGTMSTPARWIIEEVCKNTAGRHIAPFRFGPAYLADVQIDKTPDGSWRTFESGDPIAINLTLEFMEITIITREDIENLGL